MVAASHIQLEMILKFKIMKLKFSSLHHNQSLAPFCIAEMVINTIIAESATAQCFIYQTNISVGKHKDYFYLWLYLIITGAAQVKIRLEVHNPWVIRSGDFLWNCWPKGIGPQ